MKLLTVSKSLFIIILLIFCLPNQAKCQRFKAYVLTPPEKKLQGVNKLAVLSFGNLSSYSSKDAGIDLGTKLADYLTAELVKDYRGGDKSKIYIKGVRTNVFNVIERTQLDQVLKEQNFQISGAVDDNQAVEIGKLLGLDALVLGSLSYTYKDEKEEVLKNTDKDGKITYTYPIKRTVTAEARMKIISVKTAQILGTKNSSISREDAKSSDKGYPSFQSLQDPHLLADACYQSIALYFVNYFTPYFSYENFDIKNIKVKEYKARADDAEKFLKQGEINSAYKLYKAIYDVDNYNPQVAYNLGVLYEVVGDYDQAFEVYSVAYELDKDDKDYVRAYKRSQSLKELAKELASIGINIEKYEFEQATTNALAKKLTTKGSKTDRVPAYESADVTSKVIANIPGGTELTIVEQSGIFYLVNLLGGKKGYLNSKDVKAEK
jgi:tetratricopeptide (TPR) repeat protein